MTSLFAAVLLACSQGASPTGPEGDPAPAATHVEVEPSSVSAPVSDTVHVVARVTDGSGAELNRAVSWTIQDPDVARVNEQGVVLARSGGATYLVADIEGARDSARVTVDPPAASQPPAIPDGVTISEVERTDSTVRYRAEWGVADGAEEYPWDAGANNGGWIQRLFTLSSRSTRFEVERLSSDVQSFFCVEGLNPGGTSNEASCTGYTVPAASSSTSSPPPPSSGEIPQPDSDDRVLFDTRAGGSHDLQAMTTEAEVQAIFQDPTPYPDAGWGLTTDFDGLGTHAIRLEWPQTSNSDVSRLIIVDDLGSPAPSELYVQFKVWMGRTETGGGIGEIGAFDYTNPNESGASRKWIRVIGNTFNGDLAKHTFVFNGGNPHGARVGVNGNSDAWFFGSWSDGDLINRRLTWTFYLRAESSQGAADGVVRLWQDGNMIFERTGLTLNTDDFNRWQFPMIMRSPVQDQTEYIWDVLAWDPQ